MAWTYGTNTLNPGQSQRWWLWWAGYPGFEIIGVRCITPGAEIQVTTPGVQMNGDGSTTYFVTVSNVSATAVQYNFRGAALGWAWGVNTLNPGQTQRWWLWWPGYPGLEIIGVRCITAGAEIQYTVPGVQLNGDGSTTYYISLRNIGAGVVQYNFCGAPIC
jgi:hypothetical protein